MLTKYYADDKIKKNGMGWAYDTYREGRGVYRVLVGKLEGERDHSEGLGIEGRRILKLILKKSVGNAWARLIWLGIGTSGRPF